MDALMAALVLGAVTQASDATPWLAAILADRFASPRLAIVCACAAFAITYALGVVGGLILAPLMTPSAALLLLALALVLSGITTGIRRKAPDRLAGWRIGRIATTFLGLLVVAFGDRMQFVVVALAARSSLPWAAGVGATIGATAVVAAAATLGERAWTALPLRAIRLTAALVLTATGAFLGLRATGLV